MILNLFCEMKNSPEEEFHLEFNVKYAKDCWPKIKINIYRVKYEL